MNCRQSHPEHARHGGSHFETTAITAAKRPQRGKVNHDERTTRGKRCAPANSFDHLDIRGSGPRFSLIRAAEQNWSVGRTGRAIAISITLSVARNFTISRRYTFKSANNVPVAMAKVFAFYLVFTPITTIAGNHLVETPDVERIPGDRPSTWS
ncbi:MAG: hypothetical protein MZU97_06445 [Bacillus subtilis]|nr:hypothetical protein [Bacillus subtilis]